MPNKIYSIPDTYDWNEFRQNLLTLMDSHGYNQSTLAQKVGLNVTSVSRYLQNRTPDMLAAIRIADHFNVSVDWLVGRSHNTSDGLTEEQRDIVNKYSKASPEDKNIVKLFLSKYE